MKQLLFLLLFPCLAMAQYPGNGNQKITLGEQTSADGLVYRGLAADTTRKPSVDTMAYILLDTNTNIIWQYKKAVNNAWTRLNLRQSDTTSFNYVNTYGIQTVNGAKTFTSEVTATRFNPTANTLTGTGMYAPTSTSLGFSTNGSTRMLINANGLIGINSNPTTDVLLTILLNANGYCLNLEKTFGFGALIQLKNTSPQSAGIFRVFNSADNVISEYSPTTNGINYNIGNVGIASGTTTARLQIGAGTATAAPIRLTSSGATLLNSLESGAVEFNGTNLLFTPTTTRHTVNHGLTGSATLDFLSTNAQNSRDMTIAVTGAAGGDVVSLGVPNAAVNANTSYSAWVSAANTVTVRFNNYSSGTVDPASGLFKVFVTK